jgi:hypothetical protein
LGKGANVFLASAELAAIAAITGKLPSIEESVICTINHQPSTQQVLASAFALILMLIFRNVPLVHLLAKRHASAHECRML